MFRLRLILWALVLWLPVATAAEENRQIKLPSPTTHGASASKQAPVVCRPDAVSKEAGAKSIFAERIKKVLEVAHVHINEAAKRSDVDCRLVAAIVATEVGGEDKDKMVRAVSSKGARGLMQVKPATAREHGVGKEKLFDPRENVLVGTEYFLSNLPASPSSLRAGIAYALLAYNKGPGNARKLTKNGANPLTFRYVQKVRNHALVLGYIL
jgi:soluble lytic murein transglycosylase-like protein